MNERLSPFGGFAAAMLLGPLSHSRAQGVDYIKAHYTKHEYQIPMRDGVRLFTTVFSPMDTTQTYPLLMVRTQSGARPYGDESIPPRSLARAIRPRQARRGQIHPA